MAISLTDVSIDVANSVWNPDLILYEDFSTAVLGTTYPIGFSWSSGDANMRINAIDETLELQQLGNLDLSDDATESELRFNFGQDVTELWMRFKFKLPLNFAHRDNTPSSENNKFLAIWMDAYSQFGTGATMVWEFWPTNDANGISQLAYHYRDVPTDTNTGHRQYFDFAKPEDIGVFNDFVIRIKACSSSLAGDGIIQLWMKRPTDNAHILYHNETDAQLNLPPSDPIQGWRQGYLLGWANSGYDEDTIFTYDDFYVGKTAASINFTAP